MTCGFLQSVLLHPNAQQVQQITSEATEKPLTEAAVKSRPGAAGLRAIFAAMCKLGCLRNQLG